VVRDLEVAVKKQGTIDLLPTGTCFEDVTLFFAQLCRESPEKRDRGGIFMVHGICLMEDGTPYSHAWIEEGVMVHAPGILAAELFSNGKAQKGFLEIEKPYFYERYRVQEYTRYSFLDLLELAARIGNVPPPWELKYRRLCRDYKEDQ
jgi:hypothetical protein